MKGLLIANIIFISLFFLVRAVQADVQMASCTTTPVPLSLDTQIATPTAVMRADMMSGTPSPMPASPSASLPLTLLTPTATSTPTLITAVLDATAANVSIAPTPTVFVPGAPATGRAR